MKSAVYFKLRQKIESQRESDLAALDRVWSMENGTPPPKMEQETAKKGNASKTVKAVVSGFHGTFTVSQVIDAAIKADPTLGSKVAAIRTAFKRLDGVETVSQKSGAKQALYRMKKASPKDSLAELGIEDLEEAKEVPF